MRFCLFPFIQVVVADEEFLEFFSGLIPLRHRMGTGKVEHGKAFVQSSDFRAVVVRQQKPAADAFEGVSQSHMVVQSNPTAYISSVEKYGGSA